MKGWSKRSIGDIAKVTSSKRIFLSDYVGFGVPFWRSKEVIEQFNGKDVSTELFIAQERYNEIKAKFGVPTKGDILLTSVGTVGVPHLVRNDSPFYFKDGNLTWVKDIIAEVEPYYIYLWLSSNVGQKEIQNNLIGSSQKALTIDSLKKIKIFLPPLTTQKKIAGILLAYDDAIENNLRALKLLEEMAQITYEEWFVRLRFPGHTTTPINKTTGLPEGWAIKKLGEVTDLIKRGISPQYVEVDGITVINQKCVRSHRVDLSVARQTSKNKKVPDEKFLKKYDVLINSTGTGTLGRVAQYFFERSPTTVDSHVTIIRASSKISSLYLGRFIERNESYLEQLGKGATNQKELSATDLSAVVEVLVPSSDLQDKYHQYCEFIFEEVTSLSAQNIILREARDILLPRLMTGVIDAEKYQPENFLKKN